jgi:plasmid maintenance system antidote protein VapI
MKSCVSAAASRPNRLAAGCCFGTSVELWLNLRRRYDVERARDGLGEELDRIEPLRDAA